MSEPGLRKLESGLPRLEMRSRALIAKQRAMARAALPEQGGSAGRRSRAEIKAGAVLAEARRDAVAILAKAKREAATLISAASRDAARIVADARDEAVAIVDAAEAGKVTQIDTVSVQEIIRDVARRHGISPQDITGRSRSRTIVEIRHEAIVEAHLKRPDLSSPQLGRLFGNRDHTTILYALRKAGVYRGLARPEVAE